MYRYTIKAYFSFGIMDIDVVKVIITEINEHRAIDKARNLVIRESYDVVKIEEIK